MTANNLQALDHIQNFETTDTATFTYRKAFAISLILATAIPFFYGVLNYIAKGKLFIPLNSVIALLALIHVPMTIYLFFDSKIRARCVNEPVKFIVVPILIFVLCFTYFGLTAHSQSKGHAWYTAYVLLAILYWNLWHFGKQNIGVNAFLRLSESLPPQNPVERKMLLIVAILGAAVATTASGEYLINAYSNGKDYLHVLTINHYTMPVLRLIQYALSLFSFFYVIKHRERFTLSTALVFLLSINFFLSFYLVPDWPTITTIIGAATYGHGVQYLVFLGFHSVAYSDATSASKSKSTTILSRIFMPIIFIVTLYFVCDMYKFSHFIPSNWLTLSISPFFKFSNATLNNFSLAFMNAVLLTHFWIDSFVWRFKDKPGRDWMLARFKFVFAK